MVSRNFQRSRSSLKKVIWKVADRGERLHKLSQDDQRSPFERDRDRLIYSSAFHRLAGITQIVRADEANVFHTRQQHTIKVAQVGRRLAQKLQNKQEAEADFRGLDPEVVEAACIAHDLGHPPFGHIGEHVLDKLVQKNGDDQGFEGNAQSFRIITKLAVRFPDKGGIDLTRATLAACLKYPWFRHAEGKKSKKWSAYATEKEEFNFARQYHNHEEKTLEAELMDWADDVAYSVHDLEDFHRCNALPWQKVFSEKEQIIEHIIGIGKEDENRKNRLLDAHGRLESFFNGYYSELLSQPYEGSREQREQLRRMTSQLIGQFIQAVEINTNRDEDLTVKFVEDRVDEVLILKQITRDYIISSPILAAQQQGQSKVIEDLFNAIKEKSQGGKRYPDFLPVRLRYLREIAGDSPARFAADCVASLSESEAIALHARLMGLASGSVLDPIVR